MNSITSTNIGPTNITSTSTAQANASAQYDSFLRLLTAQVKNQDPLSPLDSTQFVEQLATFSSLEQQVRSNSSLDSIAATINNLHSMLAGQRLGQPLSIESTWLPYSGTPLQFDFDAPVDIDTAVLTVIDAAGLPLSSEVLDLSSRSGFWDGSTVSVDPSTASGLLKFSIDLYKQGQYAGSVAPRFDANV